MKDNREEIESAIADRDKSGWNVVALDVNWESLLHCEHCGEQIESAYEVIKDEN